MKIEKVDLCTKFQTQLVITDKQEEIENKIYTGLDKKGVTEGIREALIEFKNIKKEALISIIVHELIPLYVMNVIPLVFALPRKEISRDGWSVEKWENYVQESLVYECKISQYLIKNKVPGISKIWRVAYNQGNEIIGAGNMMECCDGNLKTAMVKGFIKNLHLRMELALQIVQSCKGMHDLELCHLDLKLENILCKSEDNTIASRLTDFATTMKIGEKTQLCSTYPSPKMAADYHEGDKKTIAAIEDDLWAIGDILYFLKYEKSLLDTCELDYEFARKRYKDFLDNLEKLEIETETLAQSKDPIDQCIAGLLCIDPGKKISLEKVVKVLEEYLKNKELIEL